jgi:hypothetical protein
LLKHDEAGFPRQFASIAFRKPTGPSGHETFIYAVGSATHHNPCVAADLDLVLDRTVSAALR